MFPKDSVQQPTPAQVIRVHHSAIAQLNPLTRPVYPSEIDVEGSLDDAEDDGHRVDMAVAEVETAPDPVEDVEGAVGAEEEDVEGGDDRWHGGLAKEEQLGENADGFED